jgi:transmembrane sensor
MADRDDPNDELITNWIRTHPEHGDPTVDVGAAWSRFRRQHELGAEVIPIRRRIAPTIWRIAAVLVVAAGSLTVWRATRKVPGVGAPLREVFALNGQRTTVTLDDGTRVSLNGGSRLRYATTNGGARDVFLDGEAYFEVTHDATRAFRVHAKRGVIRDIGTRFTIRAYAPQPNVEVAVVEGAVALSADSAGTAVELKAGDVGVLPASGNATLVPGASLDRYVAFANGALVLDGVTLADAAMELERWYGVTVTIGDSALSTRPVVARFHGESIARALDAITLALGARYERQGDTYVIRGRKK